MSDDHEKKQLAKSYTLVPAKDRSLSPEELGAWKRFKVGVRSFLAKWFGVLDDPEALERYKQARVIQEEAKALNELGDAAVKFAKARETFESIEAKKADRHLQARPVEEVSQLELSVERAEEYLENTINRLKAKGADIVIEHNPEPTPESETTEEGAEKKRPT